MEQMIREDKKKLRLRKKLLLGARGQNRSLYLLAFVISPFRSFRSETIRFWCST